MRQIIIGLLFLAGLISTNMHAQTIEGSIKGGSSNINGASVNLLQSKDSSLVKASLSNDSGVYKINYTGKGEFILQIQAVGYENFYSQPFTYNNDHKQFETFYLTEKVKDMNAVVVTTQKPFIQQQIDKTVVNIANSITAVGSNVWEVLDKVPGVIVDNGNNAISLQGKSGVMIYIDGKPTYLSGDQLANLLKSMDANTIQTIEVMTHPSAQYDAAGTAGIINIVTKKSKVKGMNGSITTGYSQGRFARENIGANLNYRSGKLNVYANYSYYNGKNWNSNDLYRKFEDAEGASGLTSPQHAYHVSKWQSHNYKIGVDYYLDTANTLGVSVNGVINPNRGTNENTTSFMNNNALDSTAITSNREFGRWTNTTYDLNYRHDFKKEGSYITADFAYALFNNKDNQYFTTTKYDALGQEKEGTSESPNPAYRWGTLPSKIDIKTGKIDYSLPLSGKAKFEAGWKSSWVTSDNDIHYYNLIENEWKTDKTVTNHFKYKENINAGYVNFNKEFSKGWTVQLGLRGEQTVSNGHQYVNDSTVKSNYISDSTVKRNYFQLFPTVYIQKKVGENNTYGLTYNRRIVRPDYEDMNPFLFYLDPYTYSQGNPFLRPQISNSVEASYAFKSLIIASLNYTHTSKVITDLLKQDDATRVTFQTKDNLGTTDNITLNVSVNVPVTKWWTSNNNLSGWRNMIQSYYMNEPLNINKNTFSYNGTNTFTLPKGFKAELSGFYHSPLVWGLFNIHSQYQVNFGIQKNIFKDNGTLKLNVNDIFRTNRSNVDIVYGNINTTVANRWDSRRLNLTFTWRFKKGTGKAKERVGGAAAEEQSRIKSN